MKIGIFGGSFNPPHQKHKNIVKELLKKHYVDKVIFVPVNTHYKKKELLPIEERYHMLELALKNEEAIFLSDYEKSSPKKTYEVLDYFKRKYPKDEIFFILGSDNLEEFYTWEKYQYMLKNYFLLVIPRENKKYNMKDLDLPYKDHIKIVDSNFNAISSTEIRQKIKEKDESFLKKYLEEEVLDYIKENKFYQ